MFDSTCVLITYVTGFINACMPLKSTRYIQVKSLLLTVIFTCVFMLVFLMFLLK